MKIPLIRENGDLIVDGIKKVLEGKLFTVVTSAPNPHETSVHKDRILIKHESVVPVFMGADVLVIHTDVAAKNFSCSRSRWVEITDDFIAISTSDKDNGGETEIFIVTGDIPPATADKSATEPADPTS